MDESHLTLGIAVTSFMIVLFIGMVLFLLVLNHNRRNKHRAELAEVRVRHAEELRRAEQEVMGQTLADVGRDLHDNIGQLLTVTRMGLNGLLGSAADAKGLQVKDNLDSTIAEVRRLSKSLDRDRWDHASLEEMVQQECARIDRMGAVQVRFHSAGIASHVTADQKVMLYRIFQEAVNNALKHARPKVLDVRIAGAEGSLLTVQDDGQGFDPEADKGTGQGLASMRRRAQLIGYLCSVASAPGAGTTITLSPWNTNPPSR